MRKKRASAKLRVARGWRIFPMAASTMLRKQYLGKNGKTQELRSKFLRVHESRKGGSTNENGNPDTFVVAEVLDR